MPKDNQLHIKGFASFSSDELSGRLKVLEQKGDILRVSFDNINYTARIKCQNFDKKEFTINISGYNFDVKIEEPLDTLINQLGFKSVRQNSLKELKAPMPGLVVDIHVYEGLAVHEGDKLISLEAMKMENIIKATGDGVVSKVLVNKSSSVEKNQLLIMFE